MKRRPSKQACIVAVLVLLALIPVAARLLGFGDQLSPANLRALIQRSGQWGELAFVTLFVGAMLGQVPGVPFVIAAPALFQLPEAFLLCFAASNLALMINFAMLRKFGVRDLVQLKRPRLRQILTELDDHPIRTVALIRTITVMFPPVTGVLALTRVRARDHAIGSALGLLLPLTILLWIAATLLESVP